MPDEILSAKAYNELLAGQEKFIGNDDLFDDNEDQAAPSNFLDRNV